MVRAAQDFDAFYEARRAEEGQPPPEGSVVVLTFDGKGVVLHREDLREATRKAAEKRRLHREQLSRFKRLKPGEKKHSKRMATVAAVYTVAPFVRSPEEFLQSLMPQSPGAKTRVVRPRPMAKRVWASLEREPEEVVAEATLEAERQDPEHVKRRVALVDGAETQLELLETSAAAYGVDVTVVLDIIHVAEYASGRRRMCSIARGAPSWSAGPGRACGAFSRARPARWRWRCGVRRPSPTSRTTYGSRSIRAPTTC